MRRKITLFTSLVILVAILMAALPNHIAYADSLYKRKIVSIVCDDSGSMSKDGSAKWAYANYALQNFCGILNSEDQLYITYMTEANAAQKASKDYTAASQKIDLSAGGIQAAVDSIRQRSSKGGTPISAVDYAFERLTQTPDNNDNTEYWLVVLTDGEFDKPGNIRVPKDELQAHVESFSTVVMPNGSSPQITYLAIGAQKEYTLDSNVGRGLHAYTCADANEITDVMAQIADRVSGRTRLGAGDFSMPNDHTVKFHTDIPLLDIVVFVQKEEVGVKSANRDGEKNIPVSRQVNTYYPGYEDLRSSAFLLGDMKEVIGSGDYTITFDHSVKAENVIILYEPALEARTNVILNGKEASKADLQDTYAGDKISIYNKLFEMGTDKEILPDVLPPSTKFELTIFENGVPVKTVTDKSMTIEDFELHAADTRILASIKIEGINPIEYSVSFTPKEQRPPVVYTIKGFDANSKGIKYADLPNNKDYSVKFIVYADGVQISKEEDVKALNPQITTSPDGNTGDIVYQKDGSILFVPTGSKNTAGGEVTVTCRIGSASGTAKYKVLPVVYTIQGFDADPKGIKYDALPENKDYFVKFIVSADGVPISKPEDVKALNPQITVSPEGNTGDVVYQKDGSIAFVPKGAKNTSGEEVTVTCSIGDASASAKYTVLPQTVYRVEAKLGGTSRSVRNEEIADNKDVTIEFTVFEDDVRITDPAQIKSLDPQISVSPQGNDGVTGYANDGRIIFTPNKAMQVDSSVSSFEVQVKCTVKGASATETYTVLVTQYAVIPVEVDQEIVKTQFFDNQVGASFYVTKDGVRMGKKDVEDLFTVQLNEEYAEKLQVRSAVAEDGTITCTPYDEDEYRLNFFKWWGNWLHYFLLPGKDVTVRLVHSYGTGENEIPVVGESLPYILLNVVLPLAIELYVLACAVTNLLLRPKFGRHAYWFSSTIDRRRSGTFDIDVPGSISKLSRKNYKQKPWKWLVPSLKAWSFDDGGMQIKAGRGGDIQCVTNDTAYIEKHITVGRDTLNVETHIVPAAFGNLSVKNVGLTRAIEGAGRFDMSYDAEKFYLTSDDNVLDANWSGQIYCYWNK